MMKAATVQARVSPGLKKQTDHILQQLGITASQLINALYAQVVMHQGVPFEMKVKTPNKKTIAAMKEIEAGGGKKFASFKEMLAD